MSDCFLKFYIIIGKQENSDEFVISSEIVNNVIEKIRQGNEIIVQFICDEGLDSHRQIWEIVRDAKDHYAFIVHEDFRFDDNFSVDKFFNLVKEYDLIYNLDKKIYGVSPSFCEEMISMEYKTLEEYFNSTKKDFKIEKII